MTPAPAASSMPPEPALADGPELDPDVVVVDDSRTNRTVLHALLRAEGYRVRVEESGDAALPFLRALKRPVVGLIDWEMPGRSGIEVCAELRAHWNTNPLFLILLTARAGPDDIVKGLRSGANDYITKPFNPPELLARVRIGNAMVMLQQSLAKRVTELEAALAENRQLHGLLPICSYCKNVRDEANYWQRVEAFVSSRTTAEFSHSICPPCLKEHFGDLLDDPSVAPNAPI